ncbi:MAG: phosphoenolpyruvate--protein phosphotransferase [Deltaproteobacteria bacterium]
MNQTHLSQDAALQILADVSQIITTSHNADETLQLTAKMIAERMRVDACAIYAYDAQENQLRLKSTIGLVPEAVDAVSMRPDEGLTGLVLQESRPLQVLEMHRHPRFKLFPNIGEGVYESFLGVPLLIYRRAIGVLTVHTFKRRSFSENEERLMTTIASQIAGLVSKALLIKELDSNTLVDFSHRAPQTLTLRGQAVAEGVGLGKALVLEQGSMEEPVRTSPWSIHEENKAFRTALDQTIKDVLGLIDRLSGLVSPDEAAIFHAHIMFMEDSVFQEKIEGYIGQGNSAAWAIYQVIHEYLVAFNNIEDAYLREKSQDLKDVGMRLLHHLGHGFGEITDKEGILVAKQVLPSDIARIDSTKIKGIITSSGGVVSHAAILARSLLIPAICVGEASLHEIHEGDMLAVDGGNGSIVIRPSEETVKDFSALLVAQDRHRSQLDRFRTLPCLTKDGERISILANVALESETLQLEHYGAEGIGLYRSEIYFLTLDSYPSLENQCETYRKIIERVPRDFPVVIRTLDLGADKAAPYMGFQKEDNPFLGFRAIRRQLKHPAVLKTQIKAILRASEGRENVRLLFPMITDLLEVKGIKRIYGECRHELTEEGYHPPQLKIGVMFEVPAAIFISHKMMPEIDFCSIGSNDLTQYVLAVDRNNTNVSNIYDPLHPAVLQMIKHLVKNCAEVNMPLELCGEMASDPDGSVILVGLGLRQLSMSASLIPLVKERMSMFTLSEAEEIADFALYEAASAMEVREKISRFHRR